MQDYSAETRPAPRAIRGRRRGTDAGPAATSLDEGLRKALLDLARRDAEMRRQLASEGRLFDGYHPDMEAIHAGNAATLDRLMGMTWPGRSKAGADGAEAAWLVVQHAIGLPEFQRRCLALVTEAALQGEAERAQAAMLLDRIWWFEGRGQVYGTQLDWDETGELSPVPIMDPDGVEARREAVGLEPLAVSVTRLRHEAAASGARPPADPSRRREEFEAWLVRTGWRLAPRSAA
jgi:hypothetical protein